MLYILLQKPIKNYERQLDYLNVIISNEGRGLGNDRERMGVTHFKKGDFPVSICNRIYD